MSEEMEETACPFNCHPLPGELSPGSSPHFPAWLSLHWNILLSILVLRSSPLPLSLLTQQNRSKPRTVAAPDVCGLGGREAWWAQGGNLYQAALCTVAGGMQQEAPHSASQREPLISHHSLPLIWSSQNGSSGQMKPHSWFGIELVVVILGERVLSFLTKQFSSFSPVFTRLCVLKLNKQTQE